MEIHRVSDALHGYFALGIRFLHVQESFDIMNRFLSKGKQNKRGKRILKMEKIR